MKPFRIIILLVIVMTAVLLSSCNLPCRHYNISSVKIDATCTESGQTSYTCDDCGYSYIDEISNPDGHYFEVTVTDVTCTDKGYTTYSCHCGYTYEAEIISPSGHNFDATTVTPNCTEVGYTEYVCKSCGFEYTGDDKAPIGHNISTEKILPTCIEQGYTKFLCSQCDLSYSIYDAEPLGHRLSESVITEVSCTDKGETKFTCVCGYEYSVINSPLGHDFLSSVTMPSISDMGSTEYICNRCNFTYTGDYRFFSQILSDAYANNSIALANGIDISMYNYNVDANGSFVSLDWAAIKEAGIDFAILKAGSSFRNGSDLGGIEPSFEKSYNEAKAAGIDLGVYFYTYAKNVEEITIDANLLISILDGKKFEYPIYLDLEDDSLAHIDSATLTEMCVTFFTILQRSGYYTGLYVNNEWLYNKVNTEFALQKFDIWYARYPSNTSYEWNTDIYGEHLGMWQYTDSGIIEEIDNIPFDMNIAYKDYPTIIKENGFNGYGENIKFVDTDKEFVYVIWDGSIKVRSHENYFTTDGYDTNKDVIGYATYASRYEVLERTDLYAKILYKGQIAYISANPIYVSFDGLY